MRRFLLLLIINTTLLGLFQTKAYDFEENGFYYNITSDSTVCITYEQVAPHIEDYGITSYFYKGVISIPSSVLHENRKYSVTEIGDSAFFCCREISSITIPSSIKHIKYRAFQNCYNIKQVIIEDGCDTLDLWYNASKIYSQTDSIRNGYFKSCPLDSVYIGRNLFYAHNSYVTGPFYQNTQLQKVTFGNGITKIEDYLFYGCSALQNFNFSNSITAIGNNAFTGCSSLTTIKLSDNLESMGTNAFRDCTSLSSIDFGNSLKTVGGFMGCTALEEIVFPKHIEYIHTFRNCTSLKKVTFGKGLKAIYSDTFNGCTALEEVIFNDANSSLSLGNNHTQGLFYDCPLKRVVLGRNVSFNDYGDYSTHGPFSYIPTLSEIIFTDSVTSIRNNQFRACDGLKELSIPANIKSVGMGSFYDCASLDSIYIGDGESALSLYGVFNTICPIRSVYIGRSLSDRSLRNLPSLKNITFGPKVITIGNYCFENCVGIEDVTITDNIFEIKNNSFLNCTGIKNLSIGKALEIIGTNCFSGCSGLEGIYIPNNVKSIGASAFKGCSNMRYALLGEGLTSLNSSTFDSCVSLVNIVIPQNILSIGNKVFNSCSSLKTIVIEDGNNTLSLGYNEYNKSGLGKGLFYDCPIDSIYLGRNVDFKYDYNYGYSAFNNGKYTLKAVEIGKKVSVMPGFAFYNCDSLKRVYTPDIQKWSKIKFGYRSNPLQFSHHIYDKDGKEIVDIVLDETVDSIGNSAFVGATSLKSIKFSEKLISIGSTAFDGCSGLSGIVLPKSLQEIGLSAFRGCPLKIVNAKMENPPFCIEVFSCYSEAPLVVPFGTKDSYKSIFEWNRFTTIIENGDLNNDGYINAGDISSIYEIIITGNENLLGDINNDGVVNAGDVSSLYSIILEE